MKNTQENLSTLTIWSRNVTTSTREPPTCAWIRADIWRQDGEICSKNRKIVPYHRCARIPRLTVSVPDYGSCTGSSLQFIEVTWFFLSWPLIKCWFSTGSRAYVRLACWKQGRIVRKPVNANPGLKVNQIITFSSIQMCFAALFCAYGDNWNSKQKAKQYTENLTAKLENSNQNSTVSWVNLIGLWTTQPRSYAFRLA